MAGQPKRGLDFAAWDVHLFDDDERFDVLIDAQGWDGFGVFFWICTKAYATNGYYYEWREETSAATIAKRMSGGIKSDTVNQVVKLCLRIGLFDNVLFDRESILTNKMMQERYMYAIEKRSVRGRTINRLYWLLKTEETKAYIVIPENEHNLSENEHNLSENDTKKSKVKESKVNRNNYYAMPSANAADTAGENIFITLPLNDKSNYSVSKSDVQHYKILYPAVDVEQQLRSMLGWLEANPSRRKTRTGIKGFITKWLNKVQDRGGVGYGFNPSDNVKNNVTTASGGNYPTGEKVF
jgi:hypothetical protein|nr:MAG TPA: protein of unknown function (DUF4373) [Caudoviricetes sp.]